MIGGTPPPASPRLGLDPYIALMSPCAMAPRGTTNGVPINLHEARTAPEALDLGRDTNQADECSQWREVPRLALGALGHLLRGEVHQGPRWAT